MRLWWGTSGKSSSKDLTNRPSKASFIDAIHRKLKITKKSSKTGISERFEDDMILSQKGMALQRSALTSLQVSRCHSFADEPRAQPLPLPELSHADVANAESNVSSNSSFDTIDMLDSRVLSPLASEYGSENITAANSPSRNKDQCHCGTKRVSKEPATPVSNNNIPNPAKTVNLSKLQIPHRSGFFSTPGSLISSPSRSPVRSCGKERIRKPTVGPKILITSGQPCSQTCSGQTCFSQISGCNSLGRDVTLLWPHSRCSPSPESKPAPFSQVQSGAVTPSHPQTGGWAHESQTDKSANFMLQTYRLPLPPSPWRKGCLIGTGTFGRVYKCFNSETGETCAMKEVTVFSDDPKSKENLQQLGQEITLLSCLRHPNIVRYIGSKTGDDMLIIYLEYVSGGSIHKIVREYGQLGEPAIRSFTRQILNGVAYLHDKNIVHRDIKGANILVDPNGTVKLADFGMAKHISGQSYPLSFKGSPYWMAPEVVRNTNGYNLAVDIWSLGCTVIEMATAKPPWSQYEGVAALFKIGNSKELPVIPEHLSDEGKDFIRQCLQRNPQDRPTASQLLKHPFVRSFRSLKFPLAISRFTNVGIHKDKEHRKKLLLSDSGVHIQRCSESKIASGSREYHVSCPVSPIGSPLLSTKPSQPTRPASSRPYTSAFPVLPLTRSRAHPRKGLHVGPTKPASIFETLSK